MPQTKVTSLDKILSVLREQGWEVETSEGTASVPDPDSPNIVRSGWSGRARHLPTKIVPATVVKAVSTEAVGYGRGSGGVTFTTKFTESGAYLADATAGPYPFMAKTPLKEVLAKIETYGPIYQRALKEQREREKREGLEREEREVAEAYAAAQAEEAEARRQVLENLQSLAGLSPEQAEAVAKMIASGGSVTQYLGAITKRENTGKGWGRGNTWVSGTYQDGKRVG